MNVIVDTEKVAGNATLQVMARLSMLVTPIMMSVIAFFALQWYNAQADADQKLSGNIHEIQQQIEPLRHRVTAVEINQDRGRKEWEQFQQDTRETLAQMQKMMVAVLEGQAAINATINAQQRQIDRQDR